MSIRPAATVLVATTGPYASGLTALLSPLKAKNQDFRLLMVKRSSKNRFMPSAHVFPGGVAETADTGPHWKALLKEETTIKREREEDERDLMFRVAAVREVFEESNILLASSLNNLSVEDKESWRQKVLKDPAQFYEMCKTCNIKPDINLIRPYSHWITPEVEKYRYDTRFYVATLPTYYTPSSLHQGQANIGEVDAMTWLSPSEAVQAFEEGKIHLPPPTWITLRHLSKFTYLDDLLSFCSPRIFSSPSSPPSLSSPNTILPYLPMVVDLQNQETRETEEREKKEPEEGEKKEKREGGQLIMALPGDEKYPIENLSGERGRIHRMKIKNANHYEYVDSANGVQDVMAKL